MCLSESKKITQEGDVKCYKILLMNSKGELVSPFYKDTNWELGEVRTAKFSNGYTEDRIASYYGSIDSGAFHTLKTLDEAKEYYEYYKEYYYTPTILSDEWYTSVIAECTIPKDSKYLYEGMVYSGSLTRFLDGYASEKLKIDRVVFKK